ncbi:MAG: hypothetical protein ACYTG5_21330, partial [Planctomycetota bacterium]|jgi:hypothetical protein
MSDRIMSGLDSRPAGAGERRFFPLMASAAAAAAILLTFFALDFMPGGDQVAPTSVEPQQLAAGDVLEETEEEADSKADDDFAGARARQVSPQLAAERKGKAAADAPTELGKIAAEAPPTGVSLAERPADLEVELQSRFENLDAGKKEGQESGASIEQALRDNLRTQTEQALKDQAGQAGNVPLQPELVLVVELPEDALADLAQSKLRSVERRADGRAGGGRAGRASRLDNFADRESDSERRRWLSDVEGFIQQPLVQYARVGAPPSPQVQGGYLAPEAKNQAVPEIIQAQGEVYRPEQEDVYFNVAGDDQAIFDYVEDLKRRTEERNGRIHMQWTAPGTIQALPGLTLDLGLGDSRTAELAQSQDKLGADARTKAGEPEKSATEGNKKPSAPATIPMTGPDEQGLRRQRRQNFVLRQRK